MIRLNLLNGRQPASIWLTTMLLMFTLFPMTASAHFIWLTLDPTSPEGTVVHIRFSESSDVNEPELLERVVGFTPYSFDFDGATNALYPSRQFDQLVAPLKGDDQHIVVGRHSLGVIEREGVRFKLDYVAKTGPSIDSARWSTVDVSQAALMNVIPSRDGDAVVLQVLFSREPVAGCQVNVLDAEGVETTGETDAEGRFRFVPANPGVASIRVRHIDATPGELDGQAYAETRTYATLTLPVGLKTQEGDLTLAPLPQVVTSFGAAMADGKLYVYGGHTGEAHDYSKDDQDRVVRRLDLNEGDNAKWETLGEGPRLQGLALVAHGSSVIRVGGFHARNDSGEAQDLWSTVEVSRFDTSTNTWSPLPNLPEPRSSHDAIVMNGSLYVVGGWAMAGEGNTTWHGTAWRLDLNKTDATWEKLPEPPFRRRALAIAAYKGKLYAIGGMNENGSTSTQVDRFDPSTNAWETIGNLEGTGMTGFGCAAFATGKHLYVSTIQGELQRLNDDEQGFTVVRKLPKARFFHRMLPIDDRHLLIVGGGSMEEGKFDQVDVIEVD